MKTGCLFLCLEVRKSNVFEAVKQAVPTRQAAEFYGVQVGRNGMVCCPFHDDKHPSMKVDRRFHCFGCQADGDVIDFTARLFGLNKKEAALKLAEDFSVSYDAKGHDPSRRRPVRRKISEELRYRQAEQKCFRVLCDYLHLLERWEKEYAPQTPEETWNPLFVEAYRKLLHTIQEYHPDVSKITDDAMIVEGMTDRKIRLIPGDYRNIKITTPEDMLVAEAFLQWKNTPES